MKKTFLSVICALLTITVFQTVNVSAQILKKNQAFKRSSEELVYFDKLIGEARKYGEVRAIVGLNAEFTAEGFLTKAERDEQHSAIRQAQNEFLADLARFNIRVVTKFESIPYLTVYANEKALRFMRESSTVRNVQEDLIMQPALEQSTGIVGAPISWSSGFGGDGSVIAILDTGVDNDHPFLQGKVVSEACYGTNDILPGLHIWESLCPGGVTETTAPDSGEPCSGGSPPCDHGTHVAGIAAGYSSSLNRYGVARDAKLIAIQIFSNYTPKDPKDPTPAGINVNTNDLVRGLERVLYLSNTTNLKITSVNISIAHSQAGAAFDCGPGSALAQVMTNLKSKSIATIISSGNSGWKHKISYPACVEPAISVGSTRDGSGGGTIDAISTFSNSAVNLDLLAPGQIITSSVPGTGYGDKSGTSMAAPHVAGAWAILKQRAPYASVDQILNALQTTGLPRTDTNGVTRSRIKIEQAQYSLQPLVQPVFDFDGDDKTDISIFRPSAGEWWYARTTDNQVISTQFGGSTDTIVPADFTGDSKTDIAVRQTSGVWYVLRSEDGTTYTDTLGTSSDIPAPADYDGDLKADVTVFSPSTGTWTIHKSSGGTDIVQFGTSGDVPVPGDYDGDGKADTAIFRPSNGQWWLNRSTAGVIVATFGNSTDKPVHGNWTTDGKTDIAVYRPATGEWFVLRSEDSSYYGFSFGAAGDIPTPGDYDGDGRLDAAVFRPSTSTWYVTRTTAGLLIQQFGVLTDKPVPSAYIP